MSSSAVRIAAIADLHVRTQDHLGYLADAFMQLADRADILLIAGDLTEMGRVAEMEHLAAVLATIPIPVIATLGNHDRRGMRRRALAKVLQGVNTTLLDGGNALVEVNGGLRVGVTGITGTGGGFLVGSAEDTPSTRMAASVMIRARREAARLRRSLAEMEKLQPEISLVLSHFSPTPTTLGDEPPLKYWMLGNALLGLTIDEYQPQLVIHGHAHLGNEMGATDAGVPVRNVALPVIGGVRILDLDDRGTTVNEEMIRISSPFVASGVSASDLR